MGCVLIAGIKQIQNYARQRCRGRYGYVSECESNEEMARFVFLCSMIDAERRTGENTNNRQIPWLESVLSGRNLPVKSFLKEDPTSECIRALPHVATPLKLTLLWS